MIFDKLLACEFVNGRCEAVLVNRRGCIRCGKNPCVYGDVRIRSKGTEPPVFINYQCSKCELMWSLSYDPDLDYDLPKSHALSNVRVGLRSDVDTSDL